MNREAERVPVPLTDQVVQSTEKVSVDWRRVDVSAQRSGTELHAGILIINADDWGRDRETTDRISDCVLRRSVSSVSAMVFMKDSERAAGIALDRGIDVGLHLNLTTPLSDGGCTSELLEHHRRVGKYLRGGSRFAQVVYHPGLAHSFEYVVASQLDEFQRIYGEAPKRIDGHHHMHLCANVLFGKLLPRGTVVRRHFSFLPGEKSLRNRLYRRSMDFVLARQHRVVDFFFALSPLEPSSRLQRVFSLASRYVIEVETHPINLDEYTFLMGPEILRQAANTEIAPRFLIAS